MQETSEARIWSLGWEDPLKEDVTVHSSIIAWSITWTEELGKPQSIGLQRVGTWLKQLSTHTTIAVAGKGHNLNDHFWTISRLFLGLHVWFLACGYGSVGASLVAQRLKHLPAMWETWVQSLGQEDPMEKEMATHSNILAWRIPWTEEPGDQIARVRCDLATKPQTTEVLECGF